MNAGTNAAGHALGSLFASSSQKSERLKELVRSQVELLTRELGELKGTAMKVGQMLSMVGESALPPEAVKILKTLQEEAPPLEWKIVQGVLEQELGKEKLSLLEIEEESIGSASLGQVHRAVRKSDGKVLALKIQHPGVDSAIESDLRTIRRLLSVTKLLPEGGRYDLLFDEVRQMLYQEIDYEAERVFTDEFRKLVAEDERYIVPETFPEFSTKRVLATSYEEGVGVDSREVRALSQERRNQLGLSAFELYLKELFVWHKMQTDPHFGNYRVRISRPKNGSSRPDQIVLFDFGAVKTFPDAFLKPYFQMVRGSVTHDFEQIEKGAVGLGFMRPDDDAELKKRFAELCLLIMEPFSEKTSEACPYDFGESDLPARAIRAGKALAFAYRLRPPPRDIVFLDRKMGGVFLFMAKLDARVHARPLLLKYVNALTNI